MGIDLLNMVSTFDYEVAGCFCEAGGPRDRADVALEVDEGAWENPAVEVEHLCASSWGEVVGPGAV